MSFTETRKEAIGVATPAHPRSGTAAIETGTIDMSLFHRCMAIAGVGTLGAAEAFIIRLQETNESGGGNATNISGAVAASFNTVNTTVTVEVRADQLTKRYVKALITPTGSNASVTYGVLIGAEPRYHPQSGDSASVTQRIVA